MIDYASILHRRQIGGLKPIRQSSMASVGRKLKKKEETKVANRLEAPKKQDIFSQFTFINRYSSTVFHPSLCLWTIMDSGYTHTHHRTCCNLVASPVVPNGGVGRGNLTNLLWCTLLVLYFEFDTHRCTSTLQHTAHTTQHNTFKFQRSYHHYHCLTLHFSLILFFSGSNY